MQWRVAVTHDDIDGSVHAALESAGFLPVSCPVLQQGPAPDARRLEIEARRLEAYDWVICSSVRGVQALSAARGSPFPSRTRTAAVGSVTAAAMIAAGAVEPIVAGTFTAAALWEKLKTVEAWPGRRVLVATVAGGRRDLIDGLIAAGANVTELEAYLMMPRDAADIRANWADVHPDAVILGSAATAAHLVDAVGVDALSELRLIVPIGPTTATALRERGIAASPPPQATFAAVIARLVSMRDRSAADEDRARVNPEELGPVRRSSGRVDPSESG